MVTKITTADAASGTTSLFLCFSVGQRIDARFDIEAEMYPVNSLEDKFLIAYATQHLGRFEVKDGHGCSHLSATNFFLHITWWLGAGCFLFGRAKGRQDFRTNPQVYGVPAPPPGAATTSFPSPPHAKPDNLANV
ncbi:hypothetical protein V6N13_023669 [Hibiscus sabdariffa]